MKFLFLLKSNQSYGSWNSKAGLTNSSTFLADALSEDFENLECKVATCIDGNNVDKEVHDYKPDACFIEAIWVTPSKLRELVILHPTVLFVIRIHSCTPFLAHEGHAIEWLKEYSKIKGVVVSFNNHQTNHEFKHLLNPIYLPNAYDQDLLFGKTPPKAYLKFMHKHDLAGHRHTLDIGCFGAIRPLKNQLIQAVAAIRFGDKYGKKVRFHINSERIENSGENILKNIEALFQGTQHQLVEYEWLKRHQFLHVIAQMDLCLQVSFTESFNIVTADSIAEHVPCIVSPEIDWMPDFTKVSVSDSEEMADKIKDAIEHRKYFVAYSLNALKQYHEHAIITWGRFIGTLRHK